jgi:deoxyadenosine/deoxycytidine kinase
MPIIIVEGSIGAGKTVLSKQLASDLKAYPILEEVLEDGDKRGCPWLKKYYEKNEKQCPHTQLVCPEDWMLPGIAFKTQMWFLSYRFMTYQYMHSKRDSAIYIGDRSLYGDACFARVQRQMQKMDRDEFETYYNLLKAMQSVLSPPEIIVYLTDSPEYLLERIKNRGRGMESVIDLDYLTLLGEQYDYTMAEQKASKHTIVTSVMCRTIEGSNGRVDTESSYYQNLLKLCREVSSIYVGA